MKKWRWPLWIDLMATPAIFAWAHPTAEAPCAVRSDLAPLAFRRGAIVQMPAARANLPRLSFAMVPNTPDPSSPETKQPAPSGRREAPACNGAPVGCDAWSVPISGGSSQSGMISTGDLCRSSALMNTRVGSILDWRAHRPHRGSLTNSGASVAASIVAIVSRTQRAFNCMRWRGKSGSSFSK